MCNSYVCRVAYFCYYRIKFLGISEPYQLGAGTKHACVIFSHYLLWTSINAFHGKPCAYKLISYLPTQGHWPTVASVGKRDLESAGILRFST